MYFTFPNAKVQPAVFRCKFKNDKNRTCSFKTMILKRRLHKRLIMRFRTNFMIKSNHIAYIL